MLSVFCHVIDSLQAYRVPSFRFHGDYARRFIEKVCQEDRESHIYGSDAVVIRTEGGFGDQLIRTLCALVFSLVMNIKVSDAKSPFLWIGMNNFTPLRGIQVIPIADLHSIRFPRERLIALGWDLIEN
jgi:hypothetical protein